jgi:hypothetical protein
VLWLVTKVCMIDCSMLLSFVASRFVLTLESKGVPVLMYSMSVWLVRKVCTIDLQRIGYSFVGAKKSCSTMEEVEMEKERL